ncbi:MAG: DUF6677 family protein [Phycisphaerales bacterium]
MNLLAAVLAWALPGLGHWSLGYRRRGRLIGAGILSLYFGGLLIGGVDVIDRREDYWWYCGQTLAGPITPVIDWWIGRQYITEDREGRRLDPPLKPHPVLPEGDAYLEEHRLAFDPDYRPAFSVSLARTNELGTLYTTIAGMLNLLAILDVLYMAPFAGVAGRKGDTA